MNKFEISQARKASGMNKKIIYQVLLRCFSESGTLREVTDKLEYIASLGVDIVYFSSFCKADTDDRWDYWSPRQRNSQTGNPKNPYRISDHFKIDEEYGTHEDFRELVQRAHSLGLLVMTDIVYLHCGPGEFAERHSDFLKRDENGEVVCNRYHFPELDFENPSLCEYLWNNMELWVKDFDVDGYRCDVGDSVPLWFWREGRSRVEKIKPDILMLNEGECPEHLLDAFDASYDVLWSDSIRRAISGECSACEVRAAAASSAARYPDGALVLRAYENHDYANDSYEQRLDRMFSQTAEAAIVVNFMLDGVPFIYNGNEFGDSRRHSMWSRAGDNLCIDWSISESKSGKRRISLIRKLCELRHTLTSLTEGTTVWEKHSRLVIFSRDAAGQTVRVVANFGKDDENTVLSGTQIILMERAVINGDTATVSSGGYIVTKSDVGELT